jgi:hypothetical protein
MWRIVTSQPNGAMARIAPRFLVPQPNGKQQIFAGLATDDKILLV